MKTFYSATKFGFACATAAVLAVGSAAADDTASMWDLTTASNGENSAEVLSAGVTDQPSVAFTCINGKFRTIVSTKPQDLSQLLSPGDKSGVSRERFFSLLINGEKASLDRWMKNRTRGLVVSVSNKPAIKIYNAALRGDTVAIQRRGKDPVEISIPTPGGEFGSFGGPCGLGTKQS